MAGKLRNPPPDLFIMQPEDAGTYREAREAYNRMAV
jgi:hypothetical protein